MRCGVSSVRVSQGRMFLLATRGSIEMSHKKGIEAAEQVYSSMLFFGADEHYDAELIYPGISSLIKAYLDASGMVMVPREPTEEMHNEWEEGYCKGFNDLPDSYERMNRDSAFHCFTTAHQAMIAAAPNPFTSESNDEPISAIQLKYEGIL